MQKKFRDNAEAPIAAFDFDGLINVNGEDTYPICGNVRSWAKPVLAFMHKVGIKIIIWTSRDVAYNQDERQMYDDLTPMLDFLNKNGIHYDAINKSVQYAPYHYNGRKIYAHMYIDDRGFGWHESPTIMLEVLYQFLVEVCSFPPNKASECVDCVHHLEEVQDWMIEGVKHWKDGDTLWLTHT